MKRTTKLAVGLLALNGLKPAAVKLALRHEPLRTALLQRMVQPGTSDAEIQSWARGIHKITGQDIDYTEGYLIRMRDNKRSAL